MSWAQQQQQSSSTMSSPPSPLVWFLLLDYVTGEPYKRTTVSSVLRSSLVVPVVDQLRDAVHLKYDKPNYLKDIPSGALLVYKNRTAFDEGVEKPLDPTESLGSLGSKENMLVVVVPSSSSSRSVVETKYFLYLKPRTENDGSDPVCALARYTELAERIRGNCCRIVGMKCLNAK